MADQLEHVSLAAFCASQPGVRAWLAPPPRPSPPSPKPSFAPLPIHTHHANDPPRRYADVLPQFLAGFNNAVDVAVELGRDTPESLQSRLAGNVEINVDEWRQTTEYYPPHASDLDQVAWFWTFVEEMPMPQRRKLLFWLTGFSRLPPGGFACKIRLSVISSPVPSLKAHPSQGLSTVRFDRTVAVVSPGCRRPSQRCRKRQ